MLGYPRNGCIIEFPLTGVSKVYRIVTLCFIEIARCQRAPTSKVQVSQASWIRRTCSDSLSSQPVFVTPTTLSLPLSMSLYLSLAMFIYPFHSLASSGHCLPLACRAGGKHPACFEASGSCYSLRNRAFADNLSCCSS